MLRTSVAAGGGSAITQTVIARYADSTGAVHETTVTEGMTLTIAQYQSIHLDCADTISTDVDADTFDEAWVNIWHRVDWGEALGGTWQYPAGAGYSADEDVGSGAFGRVFTTTGTKTVRVRSKDTAGNEATRTFYVAVNTLGSATNIATSGAWPTFASNTVYSLNLGGDYSAKGTLSLNGLVNVCFITTGSGAAPIISEVDIDTRNNVDTSMTRAAACRFVGMDIAHVTWQAVGCDFCVFVNGRVRGVSFPPTGYFYSEAVKNNTGATRAGNHRVARGFTLWNTGELNDSPISASYCLIGSCNYPIYQGVDMCRNAGSGEHVMRSYMPGQVARYNRLRATGVSIVSWLKGSALGCVYAQTPDLPISDTVGDYTADRNIWTTYGPDSQLLLGYGYPAHRWVFERNQFGMAGSSDPPSGGIGCGPQNNITQLSWPPSTYDSSNEGFYACSIQENWIYPSSGLQIEITGRAMVARNNLYNMGAGGSVGVTTNAGPNRTPSGYNGPYTTTGSPPTPSAF